MSKSKGSVAFTVPLANLNIAQPSERDYGSARVRLPAHLWSQAGLGYHQPVSCSFTAGGYNWRIYCVSAFTASAVGLPEGAAIIDARVVLPPPQLSAQLDFVRAIEEAKQAGSQLTIQALQGPIQNATSLQVSVPAAPHLHLAALKVRLHQTLLVPGSHLQLAPGVWVHVLTCEPIAAARTAACSVYRITGNTAITLASESKAALVLSIAGGTAPAGTGTASEPDSTAEAEASASPVAKRSAADSASRRAPGSTQSGIKSKSNTTGAKVGRPASSSSPSASSSNTKATDITPGHTPGSSQPKKSSSKPALLKPAPARPTRFDLLSALEGSEEDS